MGRVPVSWAKELVRRMGRGKASFLSPGSPVLGSLSPTQTSEPARRLGHASLRDNHQDHGNRQTEIDSFYEYIMMSRLQLC